jgi:ankyrin repeat protein
VKELANTLKGSHALILPPASHIKLLKGTIDVRQEKLGPVGAFLAITVLCLSGQACSQEGVPQAAQGVSEASSIDMRFAQLLQACAVGDVRAVRGIVESSDRSILNLQTPVNGDTALQRATDFGHTHVVEYLLFKGASPNLAGKEGNTPLIQAAYKGDEKTVHVLLANGADPNAIEVRFSDSPLTLAARIGHAQIVKQLLAAGADADHKTKEGKTARRIVEERGFAEIIVAIDAHTSRRTE